MENKNQGQVKVIDQKELKRRKKKAKKPFSQRFKKNLPLMAFCLPGFIWFAIMSYLPMFGVIIPFKDYKVFSKNFFYNLFHSEWIGFDNFKFFFQSNDAWVIIRNTIL